MTREEIEALADEFQASLTEDGSNKSDLKNNKTYISDAELSKLKLALRKDRYTYNGYADLSFERGNQYKADNFLRTLKEEQVATALNYLLNYGSIPTKDTLNKILGDNSVGPNEYKTLVKDLNTYLNTNGYTVDDIQSNIMKNGGKIYNQRGELETDFATDTPSSDFAPTDSDDFDVDSFIDTYANDYYKQAYDVERKGTVANSMYNNLLDNYQSTAMEDQALANATLQQYAQQQAATVKSITDQVKAERMARLRAGMNESQIANQDMQLLMANVNALNEQVSAANANKMQAQYNYNTAQQQAYNDYLAQAQTLGSTGSAFAAADAGDLTTQIKRRYKQLTDLGYTPGKTTAQQAANDVGVQKQ